MKPETIFSIVLIVALIIFFSFISIVCDYLSKKWDREVSGFEVMAMGVFIFIILSYFWWLITGNPPAPDMDSKYF